MAEAWIYISHPSLSDNDAVLVTESAFELLHEKFGWVVDTDEGEEDAEVVEMLPRTFGSTLDTESTSSESRKKASAES